MGVLEVRHLLSYKRHFNCNDLRCVTVATIAGAIYVMSSNLMTDVSMLETSLRGEVEEAERQSYRELVLSFSVSGKRPGIDRRKNYKTCRH